MTRDEIFNKALNINNNNKALQDILHKSTCAEAGICPECGENVTAGIYSKADKQGLGDYFYSECINKHKSNVHYINNDDDDY